MSEEDPSFDAAAAAAEETPASELPQLSPEPQEGFAGFAVLFVAFVLAILFLQRSRKKRSTDGEAPEPAKKGETPTKGAAKGETPTKGAAKSAPPTKAATPSAAAADGADGDPSCCAMCATEMPQLTWRNAERQRLFCCGASLCKGCFDETAQKVASSAVDDGTAEDVPSCPQCSGSLLMSDSVQMEKLREHAEAGKAWAQYELGSRCESGNQGVTQELADAAYWYELANEQGYPLAPASLGACLLIGWEGTEKDYARAKKVLQPAAKKGDARAQRFLAQIFDGGLGVPPSQSDSILWLERAAEQGFAQGQADLGYMFEHGRGVTRSVKTARKWYKLAADQGERNAQVCTVRTLTPTLTLTRTRTLAQP